jgi:hypothetical protein
MDLQALGFDRHPVFVAVRKIQFSDSSLWNRLRIGLLVNQFPGAVFLLPRIVRHLSFRFFSLFHLTCVSYSAVWLDELKSPLARAFAAQPSLVAALLALPKSARAEVRAHLLRCAVGCVSLVSLF